MSDLRKRAWVVLSGAWRLRWDEVKDAALLGELRLMKRQGIIRDDGRYFRVTKNSVYNVPVWEENE